MPLKHATETAYLILLGVVIALAGFAASILPPYPAGLPYWAVLTTLACLYPIVLTRTFRTNRADYEFRMLHWFPLGTFVLWIVFEVVAPYAYILNILKLGFFFLWSLPLVALGIAFMIIFAVHVLRRSRIRVTTLSLLLILFTIGALVAEARNINPKLQAAIFPEKVPTIAAVADTYNRVVAYLATISGSGSKPPIAMTGSSSSKGMVNSSAQSSTMAFVSSVSSAYAIRSSMPPIAQDRNPGKLPKSGPESIALISTTLLGLYGATVHARAKKRS